MKKSIFLSASLVVAFIIMGFSVKELDFGVRKFVGDWEFQAPNAPYGYQNGVISLEKEKKELKGKVTIGSYDVELRDIETKKSQLSGYVSVEGESVQLKLNFERNSFEGVAISSQGDIPMTGKRRSK